MVRAKATDPDFRMGLEHLAAREMAAAGKTVAEFVRPFVLEMPPVKRRADFVLGTEMVEEKKTGEEQAQAMLVGAEARVALGMVLILAKVIWMKTRILIEYGSGCHIFKILRRSSLRA